ncbi:hypothetical protein NECID01_1655 [Nematocida sp. AWRm77]|nr:hypothetical protein NECID01_1655 [Nematocida sp. AWRm77]
MDIVYVGVDTNVFLDTLECLKGLIKHINSINMGLFVPSVVLRELDGLKTNSPAARTALHFIESESTRTNKKVYLEPSIKKKGENNDDTFGLACHMNNVSVILSNDTALRIKVQSIGTPALSTHGKSPDLLFKEIQEYVEKFDDFMEYELRDDMSTPIQNMNTSIAQELYNRKIHPILVQELGEELVPMYTPKEISISLEVLIKYVIKNYSLFDGKIPRFAKKPLKSSASQRLKNRM